MNPTRTDAQSTAAIAAWPPLGRPLTRPRRARMVPALMAMAGAALVAALGAALGAALVGGALRAAVPLPLPQAAWPGRAVAGHAFLMMVGFMATLIGLERAQALRQRWAWLAPAGTGLAAVLWLQGALSAAVTVAMVAAALLVAVHTAIALRQWARHTALLLAASLALLAGTAFLWRHAPAARVVTWWFDFLVLTVVAERVEMTRLMPPRAAEGWQLWTGVAMLLGSSVAWTLGDGAVARAGGALQGLALIGLALWLASYDVARRTVHTRGLARYMALSLLSGYVWLGVSGAAWMAGMAGWATRDAALHALGVGFVFSMMMGHAPVIVPALTGWRLRYTPAFYVPLLLLHASVLLRVLHAGGALPAVGLAGADPALRVAAVGHLAALGAFVLVLVLALVLPRVLTRVHARWAGRVERPRG